MTFINFSPLTFLFFANIIRGFSQQFRSNYSFEQFPNAITTSYRNTIIYIYYKISFCLSKKMRGKFSIDTFWNSVQLDCGRRVGVGFAMWILTMVEWNAYDACVYRFRLFSFSLYALIDYGRSTDRFYPR